MASELSKLKALKTLNIGIYLHIIIYNIDNNSIGSEGAKAIAPALSELKLLTTLDIRNYLHVIIYIHR